MMRFGLLFLFLGFAASVRADEAPLDLKQTTITFTGHATLHDFHGAAQEIAGHAQIDPADPNLVTSALLDIGAALLTTFQDTRDEHMRRWLHVDTNPQIEFRLTHITCLSGDPARASRAQPALFTVQGGFTLNRHVNPLAVQVTGWREGRQLVIDGATTIDTTQYGLPIVSQYFLTVDRNVDVKFHLVFKLPPR